MAIEVMVKVMKYDLPPREKFVLMLYANYANPDGEGVWPGQKTIASLSGYTRVTINKVTAILNGCELLIPDGRSEHKTLKWKINTRWFGDRIYVEKKITEYNQKHNTDTGDDVDIPPVNTGLHLPVNTGLHNTSVNTSVKNLAEKPRKGFIELSLGNNKPEFPPDVIDNLDAFMLEYPKLVVDSKAKWIKQARVWRSMGLRPADIRKMCQYTKREGWGVAQPASITNAYNMMKSSVVEDVVVPR